MHLNELLQKRLVFVSGKGGVGKTTVAVLLGLTAAALKKKTLLVEMNSAGRISPLFNAEAKPADEISLAPCLSAVNLVPKNCFEEYVLMQIRFKSIYELFFNNKYVTNFLGATPGLNEILLLGKIYDLERQKKNRLSEENFYDLIIVDMPATGHGLSAMEVPHVLISAVKAGPLYNNAIRMNSLFKDAQRTAFCLVTLAEEMPVCETVDFARALREKTDVHFGPLFVNAVMPETVKIPGVREARLPEDLEIYRDYYLLASDRAKLNKDYLMELADKFRDFGRIVLPYQFHDLCTAKDFKPLVEQLKQILLTSSSL